MHLSDPLEDVAEDTILKKDESSKQQKRHSAFHEDFSKALKIVLALSNLDLHVSNLRLALGIQCLSPAAGPYYFRDFFYAEVGHKFYA